MVTHGSALTYADAWESLDSKGPPRVVWLRQVNGERIVVLLGAFDPPTLAHVRIARAAARREDVPAAFCFTKVLLARPSDELLAPVDRLRFLEEIARRERLGLAIANRGTYLEVGRALRASGVDATFVIGADKLHKLADPSFYPDRDDGVAATFDELRFVVVPRAGAPVDRDDVGVLAVEEAFNDTTEASISSTEVRRRIRRGEPVDALVPPEVARGLGGYTAAR